MQIHTVHEKLPRPIGSPNRLAQSARPIGSPNRLAQSARPIGSPNRLAQSARPCKLIAALLLIVWPGSPQSQPAPTTVPKPAEAPAPKPPPTPIEIVRKHLLKKDDANALPVLREFLQANPKHADALEAQFLVGQIQARNKQVVEAISTFESLTLRHRGTEWAAQAYEQCALLQEQRRSFSEAQRAREDLLRNNPASPVTLKIWNPVADELYESRKFAEAAELYAKFEKKLPPASLARLKTARALVAAKGDPTTLISAANDALKERNVVFAGQLGFCTMGDYEGTEGNDAWPAARQKDLEKAVSALCRRYKLPASKISYHKALDLRTPPSSCPGSNYIPSIPDIIKHVTENLQ